jgi:hypothetical protein
MVMRVVTVKANGLLLEAQSGGDARALPTMLQNAVNAGYSINDISARVVSQAEYAQILAQQPASNAPINPIYLDSDYQELDNNLRTLTPAQIKALALSANSIPLLQTLIGKILLVLATKT